MVFERCETSVRAAALGLNPVNLITSNTLWRAFSLTLGWLFTTLETVERETPAFLAMSSSLNSDISLLISLKSYENPRALSDKQLYFESG